MGDKGSQIRIFLADTGEEVAMAKDAQIHLSPTEEPEQEPSVWSPHSYEITGTMTIPPEEAEHFRKFIEDMKFSRKELRKMYHAVTHGGAIVFQSYTNVEYDNGETEEFLRNVYINRPRILRKMIAANRRFRFKYDIVPHFDPKDKIILSEFGIDL
jgi:hypothetical protein